MSLSKSNNKSLLVLGLEDLEINFLGQDPTRNLCWFLAIGGMYISYKFEVLYEKEKAGEGFMLTCLHFDLYEKGKGYYCSWSQL